MCTNTLLTVVYDYYDSLHIFTIFGKLCMNHIDSLKHQCDIEINRLEFKLRFVSVNAFFFENDSLMIKLNNYSSFINKIKGD